LSEVTVMHNTIVFCPSLRHGQPVGNYRGFRNFLNSTNSGRKWCIWQEICDVILYKTFFWNLCISCSNTL